MLGLHCVNSLRHIFPTNFKRSKPRWVTWERCWKVTHCGFDAYFYNFLVYYKQYQSDDVVFSFYRDRNNLVSRTNHRALSACWSSTMNPYHCQCSPAVLLQGYLQTPTLYTLDWTSRLLYTGPLRNFPTSFLTESSNFLCTSRSRLWRHLFLRSCKDGWPPLPKRQNSLEHFQGLLAPHIQTWRRRCGPRFVNEVPYGPNRGVFVHRVCITRLLQCCIEGQHRDWSFESHMSVFIRSWRFLWYLTRLFVNWSE